MCDDAYATFRHPAVCPLVQIGPTTGCSSCSTGRRSRSRTSPSSSSAACSTTCSASAASASTIVGATSGDTGSAAIDAVAGRDNVDIVVLYPDGRVSDVQRRQMTTVDAPNVRTVAIEGTFDDCQDLVKAMFADEPFRAEHRLGAVNSINWARVMAQIVYYVTGHAISALPRRCRSRCRPATSATCWPGGSPAGWALPVERLVIGSNRNDILARFLHSGIMATSLVVPTLSPSMDIQVSSNFERLLFELNHRDGGTDGRAAAALPGHRLADRSKPTSSTIVDGGVRRRPRRRRRRPCAVIADDLRRHRCAGRPAHRGRARRRPGLPAGRAGTSRWSVGHRPSGQVPRRRREGDRACGLPLPAHLADLFDRPERTVDLPNDLAAVEALRRRRDARYVARLGGKLDNVCRLARRRRAHARADGEPWRIGTRGTGRCRSVLPVLLRGCRLWSRTVRRQPWRAGPPYPGQFTGRKVLMSVESTEALERSVLESKDREQLLAIAAALGVKATSRAKKADIIAKILEQTGSGAGPAAAAGARAPGRPQRQWPPAVDRAGAGRRDGTDGSVDGGPSTRSGPSRRRRPRRPPGRRRRASWPRRATSRWPSGSSPSAAIRRPTGRAPDPAPAT